MVNEKDPHDVPYLGPEDGDLDDDAEATSIMGADQRRLLQRAARQGSAAFRAAAKQIAGEAESTRITARPPPSPDASPVVVPQSAPVRAASEPPKAAATRVRAAGAGWPRTTLLMFAALVAAVCIALAR